MTTQVTRQELIDQLEWNSGGHGLGLCSFGNAILWRQSRPGPGERDLKGIVAVSCPQESYTDEELAKIAEFNKRLTAKYDEMFRVRMGANLILIGKMDNGRWLRKRLTWEIGSMYSDTLDEAIKFMTPKEES